MASTYILGYDKTVIDREVSKLSIKNLWNEHHTLVPTFLVCNDLRLHNGGILRCRHKTGETCTTLCATCLEVLKAIMEKARKA